MRRGLVATIALVVAVALIFLIERRPSSPIGTFAECAVVIGLLVVFAWATRGLARNMLVMLISLLFGLTVIDGGLRALEKEDPDVPDAKTNNFGMSTTRPVVGWGASRPGVFRVLRTYSDGRVVYDVHVTIDQTLNRKTVPSGDDAPIAFFGDSFIFGDGVNDDETLPQVFANLNGGKIPVWNLSFGGWSPAPNLAALQAGLYKPLLKSTHRFILFTGAFHVERTACKGMWATGPSPKFVLVDGKLVNQGACTTELGQTLSRFASRFALYDRIDGYFSRNTNKDVMTYLKIVETFVALAKRDYNASTTILFKTMEDDYLKGTGYNEATLIEALRKTGADVLVETLPPIADPSRYQIQGDGHPTALANQATARQLEDYLKAVDPAALKATSKQATTP